MNRVRMMAQLGCREFCICGPRWMHIFYGGVWAAGHGLTAIIWNKWTSNKNISPLLFATGLLAQNLPNTLTGTDLVFHTKYLQFRGYGWWLHVYLMGLRHCTCACDLWSWSQRVQTPNWLVYKLVNYTRLVLGTFFKRKKLASCLFQALNITRLSARGTKAWPNDKFIVYMPGQMKYIYIHTLEV